MEEQFENFNQLCGRVTETLASFDLNKAEKIVADALRETKATPPVKTMKIWGEGFIGRILGSSCWEEISSSSGWRILKWKEKQSLLYVLSSPDDTYRWQSYKEKFLELLEYVDDNFDCAGNSVISNNVLVDKDLDHSERRTIVIIADDASPMKANGVYYTMTRAKELFKFPPNHPRPNTAYAMIDVEPNTYYLLSEFHDRYKQIKHSAFIGLCANLGAKEICIESAEINNQELNMNGDVKIPLVNLGLGLSVNKSHETGQTIVWKFGEKNKSIKDFDSPWINTEPSWKTMRDLRRENYLAELGAEFNCLDDMRINANLSAGFKSIGVSIGGAFKNMTKIRLNYKVLFWE